MMAVYMPRVLDIEKGWEREREKVLVVRASFRIPKVRCTPYISF